MGARGGDNDHDMRPATLALVALLVSCGKPPEPEPVAKAPPTPQPKPEKKPEPPAPKADAVRLVGRIRQWGDQPAPSRDADVKRTVARVAFDRCLPVIHYSDGSLDSLDAAGDVVRFSRAPVADIDRFDLAGAAWSVTPALNRPKFVPAVDSPTVEDKRREAWQQIRREGNEPVARARQVITNAGSSIPCSSVLRAGSVVVLNEEEWTAYTGGYNATRRYCSVIENGSVRHRGPGKAVPFAGTGQLYYTRLDNTGNLEGLDGLPGTVLWKMTGVAGTAPLPGSLDTFVWTAKKLLRFSVLDAKPTLEIPLTQAVQSVVVAPDGRRFAILTTGGFRILDSQGTLLAEHKHARGVVEMAAAFCPAGDHFALANDEGRGETRWPLQQVAVWTAGSSSVRLTNPAPLLPDNTTSGRLAGEGNDFYSIGYGSSDSFDHWRIDGTVIRHLHHERGRFSALTAKVLVEHPLRSGAEKRDLLKIRALPDLASEITIELPAASHAGGGWIAGDFVMLVASDIKNVPSIWLAPLAGGTVRTLAWPTPCGSNHCTGVSSTARGIAILRHAAPSQMIRSFAFDLTAGALCRDYDSDPFDLSPSGGTAALTDLQTQRTRLIDPRTGVTRWELPRGTVLFGTTAMGSAWSPDERLLVHHVKDGAIVIDATAGKVLGTVATLPNPRLVFLSNRRFAALGDFGLDLFEVPE